MANIIKFGVNGSSGGGVIEGTLSGNQLTCKSFKQNDIIHFTCSNLDVSSGLMVNGTTYDIVGADLLDGEAYIQFGGEKFHVVNGKFDITDVDAELVDDVEEIYNNGVLHESVTSVSGGVGYEVISQLDDHIHATLRMPWTGFSMRFNGFTTTKQSYKCYGVASVKNFNTNDIKVRFSSYNGQIRVISDEKIVRFSGRTTIEDVAHYDKNDTREAYAVFEIGGNSSSSSGLEIDIYEFKIAYTSLKLANVTKLSEGNVYFLHLDTAYQGSVTVGNVAYNIADNPTIDGDVYLKFNGTEFEVVFISGANVTENTILKDTWETKTATMDYIGIFTAMCEYEGNIYTCGGNGGSANLRKYVPKEDKYYPLANCDITLNYPSGTRIDNYFYVKNGNNSNFRRYNIATDTWETLNYTQAYGARCGVENHDNKVYIFGGMVTIGSTNNGGYLNCYEYNTITQTGGRAADMPEAKTTNQSSKLNNKFYLFSGMNNGGQTQTSFVYDPQTNTWSNVANTPFVKYYSGSASIEKYNSIYLFGGNDKNGRTNETYCYDAITNTYKQMTNMPNTIENTACAIDDEVYICGGYSNAQDYKTYKFGGKDSSLDIKVSYKGKQYEFTTKA